MLKSAIQNPNYIATGDASVQAGREPLQLGWYKLASQFCVGKTVLDVGCGMGDGLMILKSTASNAYGIDLDERLKSENNEIKNISEVASKSVDIITCIDVLEHVENDVEFISHLVRVACNKILLSTPNWTISRCGWAYHVREYMPHELISLFEEYGCVDLYKGSLDGEEHYHVSNIWSYCLLNKLRVSPYFAFSARCLNRLLPVAARLHSSLFLVVNVG